MRLVMDCLLILAKKRVVVSNPPHFALGVIQHDHAAQAQSCVNNTRRRVPLFCCRILDGPHCDLAGLLTSDHVAFFVAFCKISVGKNSHADRHINHVSVHNHWAGALRACWILLPHDVFRVA